MGHNDMVTDAKSAPRTPNQDSMDRLEKETLTWRSHGWPLAGSAKRIRDIALNQIADIADLARDDPDVIKLWIGEGDLPTPDFIREAATSALVSGRTRYTYSLGVPALREALDRYHRRHWNVDVGAHRFSVTAGGVQAIMQALQAVLNPGDEVVVPVPAWPNLLEIVRILGGKVVPVPYRATGEGGFRLGMDELFAAVTPRTRVIAINSPSNPTGWIMPREQMAELLDFARARGIWIVSDEVYAHFTYDGAIAPSFLELAEPTDRLIVTNTFSKNWCMTGWRMGWLVFPDGMSGLFDNLSQYNTTSVATFIQYAGIAALDEGDDFIRSVVARSATGRTIICSALDSLPHVKVFWPAGTFYFFFSVHGMKDGQTVARPAVAALKAALAQGEAPAAALRACIRAAEEGTQATAQMSPRLGRASYLGARALGVEDAGAAAVTIWLSAIGTSMEQRSAASEARS